MTRLLNRERAYRAAHTYSFIQMQKKEKFSWFSPITFIVATVKL